jgi:hypothetical protein
MERYLLQITIINNGNKIKSWKISVAYPKFPSSTLSLKLRQRCHACPTIYIYVHSDNRGALSSAHTQSSLA